MLKESIRHTSNECCQHLISYHCLHIDLISVTMQVVNQNVDGPAQLLRAFMRHWVHEPTTDCYVADIASELLTFIQERHSVNGGDAADWRAVDDVAEHVPFLLASTSAAVSVVHCMMQ